jgi:preprotein translocase subunit SecA
MRIFASDRLSAIMGRLGMKEGEAIVSPMVTRAIEKAQRRVEEQNFSSRKHVLEYDDVMNQQRQVVYARRRKILEGAIDTAFMSDAVRSIAEGILSKYSPETSAAKEWDMPAVAKELQTEFHIDFDVAKLNAGETSVAAMIEPIHDQVLAAYNSKREKVGEELMKRIEAYVYLQIIDQSWKEHLRSMETLQDAVRLRGYGQRDPLQEYKKEAFKMFESLMVRIEDETVLALIRMPPPEIQYEDAPQVAEPDESQLNFVHPDAHAPTANAQGNTGEEDGDGMIYHGSRDTSAARSAETVRREQEKIGRNDPCPCGSGQKYKKCHGRLSGETGV